MCRNRSLVKSYGISSNALRNIGDVWEETRPHLYFLGKKSGDIREV